MSDDKLTDEDFAALLRGDEPPTEVVGIGSSDAFGASAAEIQRVTRMPCGQGAHFWVDSPPDDFAYCNCGEYTYKGFVERPR